MSPEDESGSALSFEQTLSGGPFHPWSVRRLTTLVSVSKPPEGRLDLRRLNDK